MELEEHIADLDKKNAQTPSPDLHKECLILNTEYDILTSHTIENVLLKNRSNIYEHGDRAGEVLARQLKGATAKQVIKAVKMQNGEIITDQLDINDAFQCYYHNLYSSNNSYDVSSSSNFFRDLPI